MDNRLNPKSRRDHFGSKINRTHSPVLALGLPWLSVLLGSLTPLLPILPGIALLPPMGLLILLAWRFVRPGLFPVWAGLPLGAFDDLFSGQPLGSAILLWSLAMLLLELLETRFPWRGFWQDWITAGLVLAVYGILAAAFSGARLGPDLLPWLLPQLLLCVILFPIIARAVAWLDRLRLRRIRRLS